VNPKKIDRQLYILPALLSVWLIVFSAMLAWIDPAYFLINIAILIVVCILCLIHSLRILGWILAVIGAAIYFGVHFSPGGVPGDEIRVVSLGVLAILGAAVLCTFVGDQLNQVNTQVRNSRKMIEELRIIDPVSGLIRFHYARKNINTEVARCQRYNKMLCLLVARVANWNEMVDARGVDVSQQVMAEVGEELRRSIRNVDLAFINIEKIGVLLPETKLEGAIQVAQRIVENCAKKAKVGMNIGIACFPTDAIIDSELIRMAESALQISMSSGQHIVFYSQFGSVADEKVTEKTPTRPRGVLPPGKPQEENLSEEMILQVIPPPVGEGNSGVNKEGEKRRQNWVEADVVEARPEINTPFDQDLPGEEARPASESAGELNKNDWVKPYIPPVSDLHLESMVTGKNAKPAEPREEILIGIHGVDQISDLPVVERALSAIPKVFRVSMVDYSERTLVLRLAHSSENILEELKTSFALPTEDIRGGTEWIEIILKPSQ
jgi:diguanylate cyclase (GGDEF)-like protein